MIAHFNNPEWSKWPWKRWKSPLEQAKVLPTFVVNEWMYRAVTLTTAVHASRTGNLQLWFSSWVCGSCNDAFFMAMPFCDNFWQAQGCIMLTPRMPLYIVEMYATILYCSTITARRFGVPYLPESALCGLLAHLMYHTYDINGPRYLWWTWHDGDPAISKRQLNAPIGSSIWILTYCAIHAALNRWVNDWDAPRFTTLAKEIVNAVEVFLKQTVGEWTSKILQFGIFAADRMDAFHSILLRFPSLMKILFCGSVCTPLFMIAMGQLQIFSVDTIGVPGKRSYRLAIALYLGLLYRAYKLGQFNRGPLPVSVEEHKVNLALFKAIACFYAVQCVVSALGKPENHLSTGCHQKVGQSLVVKDLMGFPREEHVPVTGGPQLSSEGDYLIPDTSLDGTFDNTGGKIIVPKEGSEWYTVMGKPVPFSRRLQEMSGVFGFSAIGVMLYGYALCYPSH